MVRNIRTGARAQPDTADAAQAPQATPTPSQTIVAAASVPNRFTTPGGHVIVRRTLGIIDNMRLTRSLGAVDAANTVYMNWCLLAASIVSYDSIEFTPPTTAAECEFIIQRIGDDGFAGLAAVVEQAEADAKKKSEHDNKRKNKSPVDTFRDEVKN